MLTLSELPRNEREAVIQARARRGVEAVERCMTEALSPDDRDALAEFQLSGTVGGRKITLVDPPGPRLPDRRQRAAELDAPAGALRLAEVLERGEPRDILAAAERWNPFGPEADDELDPLRPATRELAAERGMSTTAWVRHRAEELAARLVAEKVEAAGAARAMAEEHGGDARRYRDGSALDPYVRARAHGMGCTYAEAAEWARLAGALRDDEESPVSGDELKRRNRDEEASHGLAAGFGERRVRLESDLSAAVSAADAAVAQLGASLAEAGDDRQRAAGIATRLERAHRDAAKLREELAAVRAGGRQLTEFLERIPPEARALRRDFEPAPESSATSR